MINLHVHIVKVAVYPRGANQVNPQNFDNVMTKLVINNRTDA